MRVGSSSPVRLVMATPVVSVDASASLRSAAAVLDDEEIGAAVVTKSDGGDGLLSERDVVHAIATGADPDTTTVASAMADEPLHVDAETPIDAATDLMLATGVRHLLVVTGGQTVGMVSIRDALEVIRDDQDPGHDR